jgi:pilus assembly protein CpaE
LDSPLISEMANRALERKLAKAEKAYQKSDKRKGTRLIGQMLKQDINYRGAWELLYQHYGEGFELEEFRHLITSRYFPSRLQRLQTFQDIAAESDTSKKKTPFFSRLFGTGKPQEPEPVPQMETLTTTQPIPSDMVGEQRSSDLSPVQPGTGPAIDSTIESVPSTPSAFISNLREQAPTEIIKPFKKTTAPGDKIRLVLADDIAQTRDIVIRTLRLQDEIDVVGTASNGIQAVQLARELRPDVILMDVNMPDMDGITATASIKRDSPITEIVILTVQDDIDYMRRAMLAGARDFLTKPPMIDELIQSVQRAGEYARQNRLNQPDVPLPDTIPSHVMPGNIVSVYSPRGGSGSTMLAVNLAIGLHREDKPVALVDADLIYGDVPVLFNTMSKNSILDLAPRVEELDPEIVEEVMVTHPSGVKILHPPRPERAELITGPQLNQLLRYLSRLFTYVIVDNAHRLSETTLASLDASTLIVLVSSLDIPSIARTRKFLDLVPTYKFDPQRISLVVNQFDPRVGIGEDKLTQAFGIEPCVIIPYAYTPVIESVNRGSPILTRRETFRQPVGQALTKLAQHVKIRLREIEKSVAQ